MALVLAVIAGNGRPIAALSTASTTAVANSSAVASTHSPKHAPTAAGTPPAAQSALRLLSAKEPSIIVHAGPPKTGSTALQAYLTRANVHQHLLQLDHWVYPKRVHSSRRSQHHDLAQCMMDQLEKGTCTQVFNGYASSLDHARRHGNSVIVSAEHFSQMPVVKMVQWLRHEGGGWPAHSITFVLAYRRHHDHIISQIHQHAKAHDHDLSHDGLFCQLLHLCSAHTHWRVGAVSGYNYTQLIRTHSWSHIPSPATIITRFQSELRGHGVQVRVIDLSTHPDIIKPMLCDVLHAHHTCRMIGSPPTANPSLDFDLKEVVAGAVQAGKLPQRASRGSGFQAALSALQHEKHRAKLGRPPHTCLPDDHAFTRAIFDLSMAGERDVFGASFNEAAFRTSFRHFQDAGKLCFVDLHEVLAKQAWRDCLSKVRARLP